MIRQAVLRRAMRIAEGRRPDFIIGEVDAPYLRRWWLIPRNKWFNVYLHHFMHSDDDRALHDHEYVNLSWLLAGQYVEWMFVSNPSDPFGETPLPPMQCKFRSAGDFVARLPATAHRIELTDGPVWTLFITGPRVRGWGFWCARGWRPWREFTAAENPGEVGRGCE